jgi:hypothetical protein
MVLRMVGARHTAEDATDLADWLRELTGCPTVTRTVPLRCPDGMHGDEPAAWFYAEADTAAGVARFRCLSGGHVQDLLDSAARWTYPGVWSCESCAQSIAEVVVGLHEEDGTPTWLVVAARCVGCGDVAGLTDVLVAADVDGQLPGLLSV